MRNLILAGRQKLSGASIEVPDLPVTYSVIDPVEGSTFLVFGPSEEYNSIEVQKRSVSIFFFCWKINALLI